MMNSRSASNSVSAVSEALMNESPCRSRLNRAFGQRFSNKEHTRRNTCRGSFVENRTVSNPVISISASHFTGIRTYPMSLPSEKEAVEVEDFRTWVYRYRLPVSAAQ